MRATTRAGLHGAALVALCSASAALSQQAPPTPSIQDLPRPGYEPRTIRFGELVVSPTLDLRATRDNNIFAARDRKESDVIFAIGPAVDARWRRGATDLEARAYGNLYRYADNGRENATEFGLSADGRQGLGARQTFGGRLSFDRTFQRRSDPEADFDRAREPVKINVLDGSVDYRYAGPRIGFAANAGATQVDYLPRADADRDLATYRGSVRGFLAAGNRINAFVQASANRRDARLRRDRGGVDRDVTTLGVLGGVSFDVTQKLSGEMGAGAFRADPDDPTLRRFSGVALNGRLTFRPDLRNAFTFDAFRGDVATVRIGAVGRVDTRLGLRLDQEARHNLLWHAAIGYRDVSYRGTPDQDQTYYSGEFEARYLLNRTVALVGGVDYTRRTADLPDNRFSRWRATLGVGLTY